MNHSSRLSTVRGLRWFFLVWLVIVYLWGELLVLLEGSKELFLESGMRGSFCVVMAQRAEDCVSLAQLGQVAQAQLPVLGILTLCLLSFGLLLWMNLSHTRSRRFSQCAFPIQGICVLISAVLVSEVEMALILALILALEIIFLSRQAYLVFGVSCDAMLLLILTIVIPPWKNTFWSLPSWNLLGPGGALSLLGLAALLLFVVGYLVVYLQWIRAYAQLEAAHRELEAVHEELVGASSHIAALTRLTERQRLARDLHDTLAQGLAGLIMQLQVANSYQGEQRYPHAQAIIEQAILRARTTLREARSTIEELRQASIEADELHQAIDTERAHFINTTGIPCEADLRMLSALPPALCEHVLYTIKEGLSNIARHARARSACIRVTAEAGSVQVEIRDDGIGFDPVPVEPAPGHYGLLGLRERAKLCGGQLEIASGPGVGTSLRFWVPLAGEEDFRDANHPGRDCG